MLVTESDYNKNVLSTKSLYNRFIHTQLFWKKLTVLKKLLENKFFVDNKKNK